MKRRPLTEEESQALAWAKSANRAWRKWLTPTLAEFKAEWLAAKRWYKDEAWLDALYHSPFGRPDWNERIRIVRQLLQEHLV